MLSEAAAMLSEAAAIDAREDVEGDRRGDELPAELCNRRSRRERRRCKEELEAQEAGQQASDAENLAWRRVGDRARSQARGPQADAARPGGARQAQDNTADPDTRLLKRAGGLSVNGYHAQVAASPEQVIVAADITQESNDSGQLAPMVRSARQALRASGTEESVATVLADGGYWNSPQISDVRRQGIDVLVPIENRKRTAPRTLSARQGREAQRIEECPRNPMARRSTGDDSRSSSPCPPTPSSSAVPTGSCAAALAACQAEWRLIAATHNLLKFWRAGLART